MEQQGKDNACIPQNYQGHALKENVGCRLAFTPRQAE